MEFGDPPHKRVSEFGDPPHYHVRPPPPVVNDMSLKFLFVPTCADARCITVLNENARVSHLLRVDGGTKVPKQL